MELARRDSLLVSSLQRRCNRNQASWIILRTWNNIADSVYLPAPAGDDASMPELMVLERKGKDVLLAAWIQGDGRSAEVITTIQDSIWSVDEYANKSSPGATKVVMIKTSKKDVKVYHDEIGIYGPVTRYGIYSVGDAEVGLSNIIAEGHVVGAGTIGLDSIVIMTSPSGQISAKKIAYIYPPTDDDGDGGFLDVLLSPLPGDSREEKMVILVSIGALLLGLIHNGSSNSKEVSQRGIRGVGSVLRNRRFRVISRDREG